MTRGKYQLSMTRGGVKVFRQGFGNRQEADWAVAEALVRYRDCEVPIYRRRGGAALGGAGTDRGPRPESTAPCEFNCPKLSWAESPDESGGWGVGAGRHKIATRSLGVRSLHSSFSAYSRAAM